MTTLLQKAFAEASKLSLPEQDLLASRLLAELGAEDDFTRAVGRSEHPPLRLDEDGAVRVGKSRIRLDLIVEQYENGMTAEELVRAYDTLQLADVRAVIACYLSHRDEVQAYLRRRAEKAESLKAKIESERPRISRSELMSRRSAKETVNAPTG